MNKNKILKIYPLSPMQEGMLFHALMDKNAYHYFEQTSIEIKGKIQIEKFRKSFQVLIKRYDILRTVFINEKIKEPRQVVLTEMEDDFRYQDIREFKTQEKEQYIKKYKEKDKEEGFELSKGKLIRLTLIQKTDNEYIMMWSFHHILMDGWCCGLIHQEFMTIYTAEILNMQIVLPEVKSYEDYIRWLYEKDQDEALEYWNNYLDGYEEIISLPKNVDYKKTDTYKRETKSAYISEENTTQLVKLAKEKKVTLNTLMQTLWGIILQKYNNCEDVVFGNIVSGRPGDIDGIERMIGLCINAIPVRVKIGKERKFSDLLIKVQAELLESEKYFYLPLAKIQSLTKAGRELIQYMMVFENYPVENKINEAVECHPTQLVSGKVESFEQTNYDLDLTCYPGEKLEIKIDYNAGVYDSEMVDRLKGHFENIIEVIIKDPEIEINRIDILSPQEKVKLLEEFNYNDTEYPAEKSYIELFEAQVNKNPEAVAAVCGEESITYRELNDHADIICFLLQTKGIGSNTIVGILMERSILMLSCILGIWKADAAYMPLDVSFPAERKRTLIEDSSISNLLTLSKHKDKELENICKDKWIELDRLPESKGKIGKKPFVNQDSLRYVLYTSGSTGKPKGVMVHNQGFLNHMWGMIKELEMNENSVLAQNASHCFDISVWQFVTALAVGGRVVIYPKEIILEVNSFIDRIIKDGVTILEVVPSYLSSIMDSLDNQFKEIGKLEYLLVTGEEFYGKLIERWFSKYTICMVNAYGPAEASDDISLYKIRKEIKVSRVPIGKPLQNCKVYIVDQYMNLCPIGVVGEICIGGVCVGKGYINDKERTEKSFIEDPFTEVKGSRLYKTGDLGKWTTEGILEFHGRKDYQVKIRGYRIELGEIENQLLKNRKISEGVVIDRKDKYGNSYLAGYYIKKDGEELEKEDVVKGLSDHLPDYMIPAYLIELKRFPVNTSGKIDRKALPEIEERAVSVGEFATPENEIEEKLCLIWEEILGVGRVGVHDNFFDIGGHSLRAMKIVSRIHKELNLEIPLKSFFDKPTIHELSEILTGIDSSGYKKIEKIEEKEYYPVSSAQKRFYILNQLEGASTAYNMPGMIEMEGALDRNMVEIVFHKLIERHETLRTSFEMTGGEVVQKVHKVVEFTVEYEEMDEESVKLNTSGFIRPFDLGQAPLLRVKLIKTDKDKHLLLMDTHHIISDGISEEILIREFTALYKGQKLSEQIIHYKDFSAWQNAFLKSKKMKQEEEYWLKEFKEEIPVLELPYDYPRPAVQSFEGDWIAFKVGKEVTDAFNKLLRENGATMYMGLLAVYNILLKKYSGQDEISVGSPVAGRVRPELNNVIGMFVNTLVIKSRPEGKKKFREYLKEVKEKSLKAYENQDYQFEELVDKVVSRRDLGRNPIFDVMFVIQNIEKSDLELPGLKIKIYEMDYRVSIFDLTLNVSETAEGLDCGLEYSTKLFRRETAEQMAGHFQRVLECVAENPEIEIDRIDMLNSEEKLLLLEKFNNTTIDYLFDKTVVALFEERMVIIPDFPAVEYDGKQITYRELNEKANRLAWVLRMKGIKPESIVGIMIERSLEMVIGILGILKAGGAYLPIDSELPQDRIAFMLADTEAKIVLTQKRLRTKIESKLDIINLEDIDSYKGSANNPERVNKPDDIAYIIYTSGSTGKPKGVMNTHRNIVNLVTFLEKEYYTAGDRISQVAPFNFDASVMEIFGSLLCAGTLCLFPQLKQINVNDFTDILISENIEHFMVSPSILKQMVSVLDREKALRLTLKTLTTGGEALDLSTVKRFYEITEGRIKEINIYGPTETTVFSTYYPIEYSKLDKKMNIVSIGKPIVNTRIFILQKNLTLCPIGIPGEIYISGDGVSKGYFKNQELTEKVFIQDKRYSNTLLYKTGDMGRWLKNGNIEFMGRIDCQVKIRGYRIEPGEIENILLKQGEIREAVVLVKQDKTGNKYLCAYLSANRQISKLELREYLLQNLPEYMVPSFFIQLEKLPLNTRGKIDIKLLPEVDRKLISEAEYEAPSNELEEKICQIWKEVLGVERVGIKDNFFEIGGHSLRAMNVISRIHKDLNIALPLKAMFDYQTIREFSKEIKNIASYGYEKIDKVAEKEYYEVSSSQKRLYILSQLEGAGTAYNMPGVLVIEGVLNIEKVESAFRGLIRRHEILRTSFTVKEGEIVQWIHKEAVFRVQYKEMSKEAAMIEIKGFIRPFDLSCAPLLRVEFIKTAEDNYLMLFDMHHIISDGITMGILIREFAWMYEGKKLKKLQIQYKDFSAWQNKILKSEKMKQEEAYWLKEFGEEIPVLELPYDFSRPAIQSFEGDRSEFKIGKEVKDAFNIILHEYGATMFMGILTVYNILLKKYSGQDNIVVGTPVAGRVKTELNDMMGMFVNTLAIKSQPEGWKKFSDYLLEVKEMSLKAFENQNYQFEELVDKVVIRRDLGRNPIFDVMLAMQNMEIGELELTGVKIKPFEMNSRTAIFDLTLDVTEYEEGLDFGLEYNTKLFKHETIERMASHFQRILESIIKSPNITIDQIEMLSSEEKRMILNDFNNSFLHYPKEKTILELFEEQVVKTPENIAVIYEDKKITYREFNEKTNRLSRLLRKKGVKSEHIVGIMTERSPEMLIGIFSILKAGGAYLPIAPEYPNDRIEFMLKDSGTEILLTHGKFRERINGNLDVIDLEDDRNYTENLTNLEKVNKPEDLAYIIYTSGTTGKPKGVMIEHKGVTNILFAMQALYPIYEGEYYLLKTNYSFDVSVTEIFGWILGGAGVCILGKYKEKDPKEIIDCIERNNITHINFVPSMLNVFILGLTDNDKKIISKIKYFMIAGEAIPPELLRKLFEMNPHVKYENIYGPTEITIYASYYSLGNYNNERNVPIGKPMYNTRLYIVDKNNRIVPVGIPGELCISGDGLARGYLGRPQLTAEKFTDNPFESGKKMYRTGDLVRWLPGGIVEYIGRIDHQVKIRGYRIELGEIESQLLKHEEIRETVVIAKEDSEGNKYLCAYLSANRMMKRQELQEYLVQILPEFMVPSFFIQLDKLPLNSSGKIDRKALPEAEGCNRRDFEYETPRNPSEEQLCRIWEQVFGIDRIGINDDFFMLGGNSISAIKLISYMSKGGFDFTINELFNYRTIKELVNKMKKQFFTPEQLSAEGVKKIIEAEFNVKSVLLQNNIENIPYWILYIEKKILINKYRELIAFIQKNIPAALQPLYIEPYPEKGNSENIIAPLEFKKYDDIRIMDELSIRLKERKNLVMQTLKNRKTVKQFPLSAMQQRHLMLPKRTTGFIVSLEPYIDMDIFSKAVNDLIKNQLLLRSYAIKEIVDYSWNTFDFNELYHFHYIDISFYHPTSCKMIRERIAEKLFETQFNIMQDILFDMILIKENCRDYSLVIAIDHIIFDAMSAEIIKRKLMEYYRLHLENKRVEQSLSGGFDQYIAQINEGPKYISEEELLTQFQLKEFTYTLNNLREVFKKSKTEIQFDHDVILEQDLLKDESMWTLSFAIFILYCRKYFGINEIPVSLLYNGRCYENETYFSTVGEFLDIIPIFIDTDDAPLSMIKNVQSKLKIVKENNINFMNLVYNQKLKLKWKNISGLLDGYEKNMIQFNFQGTIGEDELDRTMAFSNIDKTSECKLLDNDPAGINGLLFEAFSYNSTLKITIITVLSHDVNRLKKDLNSSVNEVMNFYKEKVNSYK